MAAPASPVKPALGRTAFITGAGQGIGRAIACRLARDGYDISIAEIPSAAERVKDVIKEIESYGRKAIYVVAGESRSSPCELPNTPLTPVPSRRARAKADLRGHRRDSRKVRTQPLHQRRERRHNAG